MNFLKEAEGETKSLFNKAKTTAISAEKKVKSEISNKSLDSKSSGGSLLGGIMSGTSSFFEKAASDPSSLGEEYIGPNYVYGKWIKSPTELGMSDGGSLKDFGNNVSGIMNYVTLLAEGGGPASKVDGKNLGDRYFLSTGAQCQDSQGNTVKRSIYIDNIANGNDPRLRDIGIGDEAMNGLIPGLLDDAINMNPTAIFGAFMQGSTPPCSNIHMKTVSANNVDGTGSGFVLNSEIKNINPCAFVNGKNPISGDSCPTKESFVNANKKMRKSNKKRSINLKNLNKKPLANVYTAMLGGLLVYILFKLMNKR
jgi:hypothetical protein